MRILNKTYLAFTVIVLIGCVSCSVTPNPNYNAKTEKYIYEETKQLVSLVEDAAALMEKDGTDAFREFSAEGSKWLNFKHYLFVYDINGKCLFHPIEKQMVGQNMMDFKDVDKRPVIKFITDVGKEPAPDASRWVFNLWEEPNYSFPRWKSSYVRKVIAPDKKIYLIGSGLYNMKIEKVFIQERVDMAADLILKKGLEPAVSEIKDNSFSLNILGSYIWVADSKGNLLVDPSYPNILKRNVAHMHDINGKPVTEEARSLLKDKDRIWIQYIGFKTQTTTPTRKLAYIRKVTVAGQDLFVWSSFAVATPIWMRL